MECIIPQKYTGNTGKLAVLGILTAGIAALTVFCLMQGSQIIFTHCYYIPIILAAYWYGRKGVLYAIFLGCMYLAAVITISAWDLSIFLAAVSRALFFAGIALVIAILSIVIHRQDENIRQSEKKFRGIWEHIQAGIILVDGKTHTIISANPEAQRLTGFTEEEMIGHLCHRFICPAEEGRCPISDLRQTIDRTVRVILTKDGREVPVLKTVTEVTIAGNPCYIETFIEIQPAGNEPCRP